MLSAKELHKIFLSALGSEIIAFSDIEKKPLEIDLKPPLPHKLRLYLFNCTNPPGGRPLGEYKIQLTLPKCKRKQRLHLDYSGGRLVFLAGYIPDIDIFVFWDPDLYKDFAYSMNFQVKALTVHTALVEKYSEQVRVLKDGRKEIVLATQAKNLTATLNRRVQITIDNVAGGNNFEQFSLL